MKILTGIFLGVLIVGMALAQLADTSTQVIGSQALEDRVGRSGVVRGEDVLEGMRQAYAKAQTYQDEGTVSHFTNSGEPDTQLPGVVFSTYFKRPNRFRFEWKDATRALDLPAPFTWPGPGLNVIWGDGKDAYTYWEPFLVDWGEPAGKEESLSMAVAGATGVSNGSVHTASTLLLPEITGFRLTEVTDVSLLREEVFEGIECYVVRGFHPFGFPIDIWVAKDDLLMRKVREIDEDGSSQEEIRRNVRLNNFIDDRAFLYTPPRKGMISLSWTLPYLISLLPLAVLIFLGRRWRYR